MINGNFEEFFVKNTKIHIIGILGISMSAIATMLQNMGCIVTGCDREYKHNNQRTADVFIYDKHEKAHILNADVVIYSSAVPEDNEELVFARKCKKLVLNRAETLNIILRQFNNVIGIAGSHGKTTATAMTTHIFMDAGLNPTAFIGGKDRALGNFLNGGNNFAIIESCEYKKSFLRLGVKTPVVLNIDNDHLDSYGSFTGIVNAFKEFCKDKINFINADDNSFNGIKNQKTISFGIDNGEYIRAVNLKESNGFYSFDILERGIKFARVKLNVQGRFNVYNALSSIAVARYYGIEYPVIVHALERFDGVWRRNEYLGKLGDADCYADYAHHPTELKEYINIVAEKKEKCIFVFQPHTYSRTELLFERFLDVLSKLNRVVVLKTYGARERYNKNGSAKRLYLALKNRTNCFYAENKKELADYLTKNDGYKYIYFVGAGDIYKTAKSIIDNNKKYNRLLNPTMLK